MLESWQLGGNTFFRAVEYIYEPAQQVSLVCDHFYFIITIKSLVNFHLRAVILFSNK